jgi:hypothetical protein
MNGHSIVNFACARNDLNGAESFADLHDLHIRNVKDLFRFERFSSVEVIGLKALKNHSLLKAIFGSQIDEPQTVLASNESSNALIHVE